MGYREDVALVVSQNVWNNILPQLPEIERSFVEGADKHEKHNGCVLLYWECIKTLADDSGPFFDRMRAVARDNPDSVLCLMLGEDGAEESFGDMYDNPFEISYYKKINIFVPAK